MNNAVFQIGADGIDTNSIVSGIQATVAEKIRAGVYADPRIARAERTNIANLTNEDDFLSFYLECLRDAVVVDINDFEIHEHRAAFSGLLVNLKKIIWKLMKFYTYRLWSQQNQTNTLLLSAIETLDNRYNEKVKKLESRLAKLETKTPAK